MINPKLEIGDNVILINMEGEMNKNFGDKGIVVSISKVFGSLQYKVKWEDGSTLDILEDADKWMTQEGFEEMMRKKKKIKEEFTIKKSILIKQIDRLLIEQVQEISVQGENGSIVKYKSNSPEWSKLYYSPEFKNYKWDGSKYVIDYSKIYKNWTTMTPDQQKNLISQRQKIKSVGSYKENENLISLGLETIPSISDFLHSMADYVSIAADLFVPGSGVIIDVLNTIVYLIEWLLTTDKNKKETLLLTTGISGLFIFLPGPAQAIAPVIKKYIKTKVIDTASKKLVTAFLSYVDRMIIGLQSKITEALKSPMAKKIVLKLTPLGTIQSILDTFSNQLKSILGQLQT
jgi:hypothetical protein